VSPSPVSKVIRCPTEDTLARYGEQNLSAQEHAAIEAHLESCEACDLATAMLRASYASSIQLAASNEASLEAFVRRTRLARELAPGANLDRFRLLRRMGMGAMGVVFAAHDAELDRNVALKVLLDDDASGDKGRLVQEARSMAKLTHPNVVAAYQIGVAGGRVFLAMELVDGSTLKEWLVARPVVTEIVRLFHLIALAVDAGHRAGILHRDLKPQNILVTRDGQPKVTDFGLAEASLAGATNSSPAGTPAYMAPEVLSGGRGGAAADQFSLAVCLHEALAGRRPHEAATLEGLREAVQRPAAIDRSIPARLRAVLVRALDPDPEKRFASTAAFGDALLAPKRSRVGLGVGAIAALTGALAIAFTLNRGVSTAQASATVPVSPVVTAAAAAPEPAPAPTPSAAPTTPVEVAPKPAKAAPATRARKPVASAAAAPEAPAPRPEASESTPDWMRSRR
jgi:predicted Ser/Thr protein kinase